MTTPFKYRQYVLIGDVEAWEVGLKHKIWGFTEQNQGLWNKTKEGEFILFYVTAPISRIFGVGQIEKKYVDDKVLWKMEKLAEKSLWKYRLKLKILQSESHDKGIPRPDEIMFNTGRKLLTQDQFLSMLKDLDSKWNSNLTKVFKKSEFKN